MSNEVCSLVISMVPIPSPGFDIILQSYKVAPWKLCKRSMGFCVPFLQLSVSIIIYLYLSKVTNPNSILKSRDITLPTNVHLVKSMVFPVVMYGCESGTIKKNLFHVYICLLTISICHTTPIPMPYGNISCVLKTKQRVVFLL